ncbi:hypothetical protein [Marinobacter sp. MMG032]|uniref:Uncharacterized protein n=1 Tax=Marinobacter sp. MMG032 TaxID=3158548 RepID=A0AAU7MPU0_9GAMM
MDIRPIEEMTHLAARLGQSGMDRIRYAGKANPTKQPRSTNIENIVLIQMQTVRPNTPGCRVNELIEGAAILDTNQSKPLNINRIFNILQCMQVINTREIKTMTGLNKRQAQKYMRAVKFILPYLEAHFNSIEESDHFIQPIKH